MLGWSVTELCSGGLSCLSRELWYCWGNQECDVDVAFSVCKYQFLKREHLDKDFIKLSQKVEEKEEKEPPRWLRHSLVAVLGQWRCRTQHQLIPTGDEKPFKASKLFRRASPRAGLSPGRAAGWHTAWGTGCLPALRLDKLRRVFLASSQTRRSESRRIQQICWQGGSSRVQRADSVASGGVRTQQL